MQHYEAAKRTAEPEVEYEMFSSASPKQLDLLHLTQLPRERAVELMQELTAVHSDEERARYRVVRMDTCADVPGLILSASELTGLCVLRDAAGTSHEYVFGPNGLRILPR